MVYVAITNTRTHARMHARKQASAHSQTRTHILTHAQGPVFLTTYLAICDSIFSAVSTGCSVHVTIGIIALCCVPVLFLFLALWHVRKHYKEGTLYFEKAPHPGMNEVWTQFKDSKGFSAKFFYLRKAYSDWSVKGEWNDDNEHARRWNFLISSFTGAFWIYALWCLAKRTILSLILNTLEGRVNAFFALCVQCADSAMLLWFLPYISLETSLLESFGAITNLLAYLSISIPIIFETSLPEWMGDFFIMVTGMFATVSSAVVSLMGLIAPAWNAFVKAQDAVRTLCGFASSSSGVGGVVAETAYSNLKSEGMDQLEGRALTESGRLDTNEEDGGQMMPSAAVGFAAAGVAPTPPARSSRAARHETEESGHIDGGISSDRDLSHSDVLFRQPNEKGTALELSAGPALSLTNVPGISSAGFIFRSTPISVSPVDGDREARKAASHQHPGGFCPAGYVPGVHHNPKPRPTPPRAPEQLRISMSSNVGVALD